MRRVNDETMQSLRHHSLVAWQRADELFIKVASIDEKQTFPTVERYEHGSQLRRAAYSVPAQTSLKDLPADTESRDSISSTLLRAPLAEVADQFDVAHRLDYIAAKRRRSAPSIPMALGHPLAGLVRATRAGTTLIT